MQAALLRLGPLGLASLCLVLSASAQELPGHAVLGRPASRQFALAEQGRTQIETAHRRVQLFSAGTLATGSASGERFVSNEVADEHGNVCVWHVDPERRISRILLQRTDGLTSLLAGGIWGARDGRGAGAQFGRLGGMAIGPDGLLYVCDEQSVRRVSLDGTVTTLARGGLLPPPAGDRNPLCAIAVADDGNVYVLDRGTRRVLRIRPTGEVSPFAQTARRWQPAGLAWFDGALHVRESGRDGERVVRISAAGQRQVVPPASPAAASSARNDHADADARTPFLPMFFMPVTGVPFGL